MAENSTHNTQNKTHFEQVFKAYFKPLCFFAYGYLNDRDSAQEIVQDVFINLWGKRETMDPQKAIKSYLYTSVKNRCLNYIRDHKKFRSQYLDIELELEIPFEDVDMFSESETRKKINNALDKLPEKCRQVFELSRFEEMKYKEIAINMGISIKTVEVQMSKALKILREELKDLIPLIIILLSI
ncbi:MAG: RNA polymerase sigma-70 factor [Bacteroidales bacterium]|nr:RNA polymerase sigma-70 factor [Bacteroidales bacterium]MCF8402439.1 RNA polymerase sigma-70 factor [Bacteroidales bacterium]